jgi:WD40 repeat protein
VRKHFPSTRSSYLTPSGALQNLRRVRDASYKSEDEKRCMPGTRVAILAGLLDWATDSDSPPVFWLSGMAGTGKSAITGSLAELLDGVGILGASFFCSRDVVERRNVKRIIPTLAHSLAICHPAYRAKLVAILEKDPDIGHYGLKEQFAKLIVAPLVSSDCNMVMVIDALDECEAPDSTRNLLAAFIRHAHLPIKILFSSRPEPQMRASLDDPESNRVLRLHDVEEDVVMQDIHLYLKNRFADLCRDRKLEDWPSQVDLQALLHLCGAFFIYASTVLEYISATGDPQWRLENLVASSSSIRTNRRYSRVDRLYTFIMESAFDGVEADERDAMRDILSAIILLYSPLPLTALVTLLDRNIHPERELMGLHSVINIPSLPERPVSIFHASFADYMADHDRSSQFFVDPTIGHAFLATKSLQCMNRHLRHNISHLPLSQHIYQSLTYSCIHWAAHLATSSRTDQMVDLLREFFDEHFLHWMEFLAWIGRFEDALTSLRVASVIFQAWRPEIRIFAADISIQELIQDALEFIPYNFEIVKSHPTEIYRSALVWLPLSSVIRKLYQDTPLLRDIPQVKAGSVKSWAACDHVLRHPDLVLHAEFSPDSARVVSATQDGTVRIWNAVIRETQLLMEGHADRVNSVSFSPDGSQIVSASSDGTLRIWDAAAGWLMLVLKGHLHDVCSAGWSADGSQVVSASRDGSVRVWDAKTGNNKQILTGGSSQVRSAAFSADGSRIVSARRDGKVHIWNVATGLIEQVLVGHSDEVNSGVFSKDSHLVVSASDDRTVRIWDTLLGETKQVLMHPSRVWSAAISWDGTRIVSASADHIVRIWNIETGQIEQVLKGHADEVNFASFSQNGSQIISASDDGTARIWSTQQRGLPPIHELDDVGDVTHGNSFILSSIVFWIHLPLL